MPAHACEDQKRTSGVLLSDLVTWNMIFHWTVARSAASKQALVIFLSLLSTAL